ncbi:MAG: hypothetical protein CL760_08965 [Chloroflexi bacterium]|nr:hypothetical protein [Chloroflexota bacterium]|tara:strand:- start:53013 stop:53270 length:258 start_codon:yes stop_codon:yes gene_type:complete
MFIFRFSFIFIFKNLYLFAKNLIVFSKHFSVFPFSLYQFRIIKVRKFKPWQIQKRHRIFFWKDIEGGFDSFQEAKNKVEEIKANR